MRALRTSNKQWFRLHGWIGVQLGVLLFVVMFSGSLATVGEELDWLANPAMRVQPAAETVSYGEMSTAVLRAYPEHEIWRIQAPRAARFAVEFQLVRPDTADFTDGLRRVYVDPHSGAIQGATGWFTIQRALRNFHMNLSLPALGIYVVGALGFLLLTSVVSALMFYKRWWRRLLVLRLDRGRRVFWSDAHRAGGLWSLWFALIMAVTGIWYFVEMGMFDAGVGLGDIPDEPPRLIEAQSCAPGHATRRLPLDDLVERARAAYPALEIKGIWLPRDPRGAVRFTGQADAWLVRQRANNLYLNPCDGSVMGRYAAEDLPLAHRWVHTADPLHFGDFGGLATKLVWLVFGLLTSALPLTGAYLWHKRQRRAVPAGRYLGGREGEDR